MKFILSRMLILVSTFLILSGFFSIDKGESWSVSDNQPQYYIYTLHLIPPLLNQENWTEKENKIVEEHFQRLKQFQDKGIVFFAGRVSTMDPEGFGIVIFKADSEAEALVIMENDPAVREGIMTAELFPFNIALMQVPPEFQASGGK